MTLRVAVSLLGIALALVGWLDWVAVGQARRNSYEMFRSLQRLGLDELTPLRVVWFLVPVAALAVVLFAMADRPTIAVVVLVIMALIVGGAGAAVLWAGVRGGIGAPVALGLACCSLLSVPTHLAARSRPT